MLLDRPGGRASCAAAHRSRREALRRLDASVEASPGRCRVSWIGRQADASVDVVVGLWNAFRGVWPAEVAEAERVARPGGRLLVVHDYGRDDVSRLRGDLPEYGSWSRRGGPFLANGFQVRVLHCFWTFESIDDATDFLGAAFGDSGHWRSRGR